MDLENEVAERKQAENALRKKAEPAWKVLSRPE